MRYTRVDVVIAMTIAGADQHGDAGDGGERLLQDRPHERRLARERPQDARSRSSAAPQRRSSRSRCWRSGLSSSTVGTLAGQVVMQGFIDRKIPIFVRRLVTMVPALVVVGDRAQPDAGARDQPGRALVRDPVRVDSARLFTSRRTLMGGLVNRRATTAVAVVVAALIVGVERLPARRRRSASARTAGTPAP